MKLGRKYSLAVETAGGGNVTIELPFSVEFEIERKSLASANTATIKLLNLAPKTRDAIYKDRYALTEHRAVQFRAGYDDFTPLIFNGEVRQAFSYRAGGAVDVVTEIQAFDGGFAMVNGFTSMTLGAGQAAVDVLRSLASTLPGLTGKPIVGDFPGSNKRGEVLFGNTWDLIQRKSGGLAAIDNGQVKILRNDEAIEGGLPLIDASTGLLGSPKRSNALLEVELLFEPRLTVGQIVALKSSVNGLFDGTYKVMGFSHRGTISPAVAGEARTTATLWLGTQPLSVIQGTALQ